jgi:GTP-binding protein Era
MTQCGYVAFLGAPNAGKSTLLNQLAGQKLAIVTPKAQTTRHRLTGIVMHEQTQLVLVDVPGVFEPPKKQKFEQAMVSCAWQNVADADVIVVLVDAARGIKGETKLLLEGLKDRLPGARRDVVLVLNKIDKMRKDELLMLTQQCGAYYDFADIYYISALKGDGVEELKAQLAARMPKGPYLYPEDQVTDMSLRILASEITREKLFLRLRDELPYSVAVETEAWEERNDGSVKVSQVIYVERESQKKIILGKGGQMLKAIGEASRGELTHMLEQTVHLFLFVKLREDWKASKEQFDYLGLSKR